jgi:hypothetical protein
VSSPRGSSPRSPSARMCAGRDSKRRTLGTGARRSAGCTCARPEFRRNLPSETCFLLLWCSSPQLSSSQASYTDHFKTFSYYNSKISLNLSSLMFQVFSGSISISAAHGSKFLALGPASSSPSFPTIITSSGLRSSVIRRLPSTCK